MTKLTQKQQTVLSYIQSYLATYQQSPLIREIQDGCQIASYKSTLDRLNSLERKGLIKRILNKHRGIHLLRPGEAASWPPPEVVAVAAPEPSVG